MTPLEAKFSQKPSKIGNFPPKFLNSPRIHAKNLILPPCPLCAFVVISTQGVTTLLEIGFNTYRTHLSCCFASNTSQIRLSQHCNGRNWILGQLKTGQYYNIAQLVVNCLSVMLSCSINLNVTLYICIILLHLTYINNNFKRFPWNYREY